MPTMDTLRRRTRLELGDDGFYFQARVQGDGFTTEFDLPANVISDVRVWVDGVETVAWNTQEIAGVLIFDAAPADGTDIQVRGQHYDLFTNEQVDVFLLSALAKHAHNQLPETDAVTLATQISSVEEHPVSILAAIEGLWSVLSQIARDVNVSSPDGYTIPRSQRYQQVLQTIKEKTDLYEDIAQQLNVGLNRIEVQRLRRVSHWTGRLVPVYRPQEVDETDLPTRVYPPRDALAPDDNPFTVEDEGAE